MKHIILYMSLLFFLSNNSVYGQQCLTNSNFASFCDTLSGPCPTFNNPSHTDGTSCLNNWYRSHGTPQVFTGPHGEFHSVYMWARVSAGQLVGEGIFAKYNFLKNHAYIIKVGVQVPAATGSFRIYAATGLTEPASPSCAYQAPPSPTHEQFIGEVFPTVNADYIIYSLSFVANDNYSQLLIYPSTTSTSQFDFYTNLVDACPDCNGIIIYNNGIIPTGDTKAGDIYAGSTAGTGGSGTVTVNATSLTNLIAVKAVHFEHEFHATVSTGTFEKGNYSNEKIITEVSANNTDSLNYVLSLTNQPKIQDENRIVVSPIPTDGILRISGNEDFRNSKIVVNDQSGRTVNQFLNNSKSNIMELDLHNLSSGIYYLKIYMKNKIVTKKIVISN
jgi:hypothetical protein